jgi:hypothetical protein
MSDSMPIQKTIEAAMLAKGWLLPTTMAAAEQLQAEIDTHPIDLPTSLQSVDAVFERIQQPHVSRLLEGAQFNDTTSASLRALAARSGGEISAETQAQMKLDGEVAQNELDQRRDANKGD